MGCNDDAGHATEYRRALVTKPSAMDPHAPCPCHHGASYGVCCKPLHDGQAAPTAERLMRSRYAAYVLKLDSYLFATWHPSTRPPSIDLDTPKWLGLQVRHHQETGDTATVEFVARYKVGGTAHRLHEVSRFIREDGRWYYVDGEFPR